MRSSYLKLLLILNLFFTIGCGFNVVVPGESNLGSDEEAVDPGFGWVQVPTNAGGMGLNSFYVMKYEAKAMLEADGTVDPLGSGIDRTTHKPVSIEDNTPWGGITPNDAALECESLGDGYRLISNAEWMAIAREAEAQPENWTGGAVGSGCLFRGNSGEVTTGDGSNVLDSCGYDGVNPGESGAGRDARSRLTLSNNFVIHDFAGNYWSWVDWDASTPGFQSGPSTCPSGSVELRDVICPALTSDDYNTAAGLHTSVEGVGLFYGSTAIDQGAICRGGDTTHGDFSGAFSMLLNNRAASTTFPKVGFRCVFSQQ